MKRLALLLLALVGAIVATMVVRTVTFSRRQVHVAAVAPLAIDRQRIVHRLSEAIQFRTVSLQSATELNDQEFGRFRDFLKSSFPSVHARLSREIINGQSILFTWAGRNPNLKPLLLMGHMDVVPVDPATATSWRYAPFSGAVAGGYIWGRGAMDDKAALMSILEAAEHLVNDGYEPERTIYLAFGHDEEIGGNNGAAKIAELLDARGVALEYVLDEGLNIFDGIIGGLSSPVALIGIAEKGYVSLGLNAQTAGGHSSIPPADNAIGIVSRALQKLNDAPFPAELRGATRQMLEYIGPEMSWPRRLALANLWLFEPLIKKQLSASPLTNAAIRTTLVPTMFNAGVKENVLPSRAEAVINLRIVPGETIVSTVARVRHVIDDTRVQVTALAQQAEPSAVADTASPSFRWLRQTIAQTAPGVIAAPALLVATTDSRHYAGLTSNIFRFLPMTLREDDTQRYHGVDERISIADYLRCVRFYAQLIRNSGKS